MENFLTKVELYNKVNQLRNFVGISEYDFPIVATSLCSSSNSISIGKIPFKTKGLRGMSSISQVSGEPHVILINQNETAEGQNFICGHELMHILLHKNAHIKLFSCFETLQPNQNAFLEWQANEGSAEFIVPMYKLLPDIKRAFPHLKKSEDFRFLKNELAQKYNVTEAVINFRFESLKYEIQQYVNGVSLSDIRVLSNKCQAKNGIRIKSLNEIENEKFRSEYCIYVFDTTNIDI